MKYAKPLIASAIVLAVMLSASIYAAGQLGDKLIAVHWGPSGQADGFDRASRAVWFMPGVALLVALGLAAIPPIMPKAGRLERSWGAYEALWLAVLAMLMIMHLAMLGVGLGYDIPIVRVIMVAVGMMLAVIGNLLGKVRYNFVFGVRTPWTLANERVWDHTHRFAGWTMALGGIVCVLAGLAAPRGAESYLFWVILLAGAGPGLAAVIYSAIDSRREERGLQG